MIGSGQRVTLAAAILAAIATPALADRIDGDWCSPAGKHLTITGAEIITPNGATLKGQYNRHEFAYIAPGGDPDAGTQIYMRLLNEEEMDLYHIKDNSAGEPEHWKRCLVNS